MTVFGIYSVPNNSSKLWRCIWSVVTRSYDVYKLITEDPKGFKAVDVSGHVMWDVKHE